MGQEGSLAALQHWMQSAITHPQGVRAGAAAAGSPSPDVEELILPSRSLSALERLEIYHRAYAARLVDCLREEYSVLAATLGSDVFDAFAVAYLQEHPSRSYTLARLGDRFPDYLQATRPAAIGDADWPEFLIDLARLERVVNLVFDGPGVEGERLLDRDRLLACPPELWEQARLDCVTCLRLVELRFRVNDCFSAVRRGESAPAMAAPGPEFLAVTRRDYRVRRHILNEPQFRLLESLQQGETVGEAIARTAAVSSVSDEGLAIELQEWFGAWTANGFFRDVLIDRPGTGAASPR